MSECAAEEEAFNRELPQGLMSGHGYMTTKKDSSELVVGNNRCSNAGIEGLPTEFILKMEPKDQIELQNIFDSENIRPRASVSRGFGCHFQARFEAI